MSISKDKTFRELLKSCLNNCKTIETCKYKPELFKEVRFIDRSNEYKKSLNELMDYIDKYVFDKTQKSEDNSIHFHFKGTLEKEILEKLINEANNETI